MKIQLQKVLILFICLHFTQSTFGQVIKKGFYFPDAGIYKVLKCDFHTHTVFSDGDLWPNRRLLEAASEDIDAVSITDHIEYTPKEAEFKEKDHNRSYDLAKKEEKAANIMLVKGTEITRGMPPGHLNAIFIKDANEFGKFVNKDSTRDGSNIEATISEAKKQGAFVFWNHPSFPGPNEIAVLYPIHQTLISKKLIDGIEVVNGPKYEPEAFQWCLENNLTILGTSDVHRILAQDLIEREMLHRSMTLVLSKNRTEEGIRDALDARRTVAICNHIMYGKEENVKAIFAGAVKLEVIGDISDGIVEFSNYSGFPFKLSLIKGNSDKKPKTIMLFGHSKAVFKLSEKDNPPFLKNGDILKVKINNIYINAKQELIYDFKL